MFKKKDFDLQNIVFIILMIAYLLFAYFAKELIATYYENANVIFGLNLLKLILSIVLSASLVYTYKDLLLVHWRKFAARSWVKYLWIVLAWIGIILVLNFTRTICKWLFGYPFIHSWNPVSFRNNQGFDVVMTGWSMVFIFLNQLIIPFAKELVFRQIMFFKHVPNLGKMVIYAIIGSIIFGLGFYHVDHSLVGCLPYMFCNIVFYILYFQTRNIWYPIFTHLLVILIMLPLSAIDSFLLPYCS